MRGEKHGATFIGDGADDGFEHFTAHDRVEARAGFVQHQQFRSMRERHQ